MTDVRRETDFEQAGDGDTAYRRCDWRNGWASCREVFEDSDALDVHVRDTHMLPSRKDDE